MIDIFSDLPVDAGFTQKPEDAGAFRERLRERGPVVRPGLVHGADIFAVRSAQTGDDGYVPAGDFDGAVTDLHGVYLTASHGDCLPLYACDPQKGAVGLAHAGWRGTLAGIAANLIRAMVREYGCRPRDIRTFVGPGIGACCFEVGPDVAEAFSDKYPWAEEHIYRLPGARPHIDLKGINAELFALEGAEDIEVSPLCTCCESERFWSWRRCADSKRMLAYIALR